VARYLVVVLALAAAIALPLATKPRRLLAVLATAGGSGSTEAATAGGSGSTAAAAGSDSTVAATERSVPGASRPTKRPVRRSAATASSSSGQLTTPADASDTPAYRYARLSQTQCEAELAARHIDYTQETAIAVAEPVRLAGPLHGVVFRTDQTARTRRTSPYEIADCRLVLALDDFAEILSRHDIVEVRHYSMYRPPTTWSDDKPATRHPGALAIDAGRFIDRTGAVLDVDRDFHGAIDAKTCGDGAAPRPATPSALALRAILCEAVDRRLFNVVLTPNYNKPHHNHFQLELTTGVSWFLVH
jgi:hypothetical protein